MHFPTPYLNNPKVDRKQIVLWENWASENLSDLPEFDRGQTQDENPGYWEPGLGPFLHNKGIHVEIAQCQATLGMGNICVSIHPPPPPRWLQEWISGFWVFPAADILPDMGLGHILPYSTHVLPNALVCLVGALICQSWAINGFLFLDKLGKMVRKFWTPGFWGWPPHSQSQAMPTFLKRSHWNRKIISLAFIGHLKC